MSLPNIPLGDGSLRTSRIAYGCWRIAPDPDFARTRGRNAVIAAYEAGYTLFDHADIYGDGLAESAFGEVLSGVPGMRDRILIATKCGVRRPDASAPYRYDLSREHILRSCEDSLRRLQIERIDLYQLHRPDWLLDPTEVAAAFDELHQSGKVGGFGVSNFSPSQFTALQRACPMKLQVHQVEISLTQRAAFTDGTLDQCLTDSITPLAWSPLAGGLLADDARRLLPQQEFYRMTELLRTVDELATDLGATRAGIALAWLLRHPAMIVPLVGSVEPDRIRAASHSAQIELSRGDWYRLLEAARGERLP